MASSSLLLRSSSVAGDVRRVVGHDPGVFDGRQSRVRSN